MLCSLLHSPALTTLRYVAVSGGVPTLRHTGPWLDNFISLTSSRLTAMGPDTQANLLSSLAVWRAKLSPAWLAMFQLNCVKQAEDGSMKADQLEQVGDNWAAGALLAVTPACCVCLQCFEVHP